MKQHITLNKKKILTLYFGVLLSTLMQAQVCFQETGDAYEVDVSNPETNTTNGVDGTLGSTYTWSVEPAANFQGIINNNGTNRITIDWGDTPTGSYTIIVDEENNGCINTQTLNITINPLPTTPTISSSTVCSGGDGQFQITGGEPNADVAFTIAGTYTSVTPNTGTITLDAAGEGVIDVTEITAQTTVTITQITNSTTGCSVNGLSIVGTISLNSTPSVNNITASVTEVCEGESFNYTITGTAGATVTYNINGGADQTEVLNGGAFTDTIITNAGDTNYTITITRIQFAGSGCEQAENQSVSVDVNPNPTSNISVIAQDICSGDDAVFIINGGIQGEIITYELNGGTATSHTFTASDATNGYEIRIAAPTSTQTLRLIDVATAAACSTSIVQNYAINIAASLPAPVVTTNDPICVGETAEFYLDGGTTAAGFTIEYTINGTAGSTTLDTNGEATVQFPNAPEGTVELIITSVSNGTCTTVITGNSTVITVNPIPETTGIQSN